MDGWFKWIGKKVFIKTKNERSYTGIILNVYELDSEHFFIEIKDKFSKLVGISINEILEIKEEL